MHLRLALLTLLSAAIGACDRAQTNAAQPASPPPSAAPAKATPPPPAPAAPAFHVAVDGEGLRLVNAETGSTRPLAFGSGFGDVVGVIERVRGLAQRGRNEDCSLDYATWPDGFYLWARDGAFLGWTLDERAKGKETTMTGIGPGSTRRELEAAHQATVETSTLGLEFLAGFSGIFEGAGPDAVITDMWAGETCIFR